MLYFTRWKALAVILTALVVCLCAVPNFFPEATVKTWPVWAQRRLVLGHDVHVQRPKRLGRAHDGRGVVRVLGPLDRADLEELPGRPRTNAGRRPWNLA